MRAWPSELTHPPFPAFPLFWGRGGLGIWGGGWAEGIFPEGEKKNQNPLSSFLFPMVFLPRALSSP